MIEGKEIEHPLSIFDLKSKNKIFKLDTILYFALFDIALRR
jgi:hypothetical protein